MIEFESETHLHFCPDCNDRGLPTEFTDNCDEGGLLYKRCAMCVARLERRQQLLEQAMEDVQ